MSRNSRRSSILVGISAAALFFSGCAALGIGGGDTDFVGPEDPTIVEESNANGRWWFIGEEPEEFLLTSPDPFHHVVASIMAPSCGVANVLVTVQAGEASAEQQVDVDPGQSALFDLALGLEVNAAILTLEPLNEPCVPGGDYREVTAALMDPTLGR